MNFLRAYTDIFTKNVHTTKDYTYKNVKNLTENKVVVVISREMDSCVVILKRRDCHKKFQSMVNERITNETFAPTTDSTIIDLKKFQDFLPRNFKDKFTCYKDLRTVSNLVGYTLLQKLISLIR